MKHTLPRLALLYTLLLATSSPAAPSWNLVWSDEFDGPDIDGTKWSHEVNGWGGGNNELQYYTARTNNSFIEDGKLVIQALEEDFTGPDGQRDYTSARLRTLNKGDWTYGRFEVRAKLPQGQGLWPAIWMLPTDWVYGGWAASGEIDIMELLGHEPDRIYGTLHYGGPWPQNVHSGGSYTAPTGDYASDFHTFAMEWGPELFVWYVDGVPYHAETSWYSTAGAYPAPFNQRFHMLLNVAVGGNWPGSPNGSTTFPQRMEIDYVRVYQANIEPPPPTVIQSVGTTRIEAEDYTTGGEGVAYHDTDAGNNGNAYRTDDVDIEVTTDAGGGYNVGWASAGEWLAFPIDVQTTGMYQVTVRVASPDGAAFRLELDGTNLTGSVSIPATGAWQNWTSVTRSNLYLTAGVHALRLHVEASGANYNWLAFAAPTPEQDSDGDSMTDTWELRHGGHPTDLSPTQDADGDGASNADEFIADTNPTNPVSRLRISALVTESGLQVTTWPASEARRYSLQSSTNPVNTDSWSDVHSQVTPTGSTLTLSDDHPLPGATYYRVGVGLPPSP